MTNPTLISTAFATSGTKNTIPETTGDLSNSATWATGFPDVTMVSKSAGGLAPRGQDMNGVLNTITENIRFQSMGGVYQFDANYATAVSGYPLGAIVWNADQTAAYRSLVAANTSALTVTTAWKQIFTSSLIDTVNSKVNISSIVQGTGNGTSVVMSQAATTNWLATKVDVTSVVQGEGTNTSNIMSQAAVTTSLNGKFPAANVVQSTGTGTATVISQAAMTNLLNQRLPVDNVVQATGGGTAVVMSQAATTNAINAIKNTATKAQNGVLVDTVTGIVEMWGRANRTGDNTTVTFPTAFGAAPYNVVISLIGVAGSGSTNNPKIGTITANSFIFSANSDETACFWRAIGTN